MMRYKVFATAILAAGISVHADQIAQYVSVAQGQDFILTNAANLESLQASAIPIAFYWATSVNQGSAPISALLNFHATSSSDATNANNEVVDSGFSGSFDITEAGAPVTLLSAVFGPNATLTANGSSASFSDSKDVSYSSNVLNLNLPEGFSFSLSNFESPSGTPQTVSIASDYLPISGTFAGNGSFSADPTDLPEPSTIALIGFALVSCALVLRRRRNEHS